MNKIKEQQCQYYLDHQEQCQEAGRLYYKKHKEQRHQYYLKHQMNLREQQRKYAARIKQEVLTHYSDFNQPICARCGITDIDVLCIDHINGNGNKERKRRGNGSHLYWWLRHNNYPKGYQTLCANCNQKKRIQEGL